MAIPSADEDKVQLKALRKRAAAKKPRPLTPEETRDLFLVDPDASTPFKPVVRLNPAMVDTAGAKLSPKGAAALLEKLSPKPKVKAAAIAPTVPKAAKAARLKVLAEGDSWFNLPDLILQADAINILSETFDVRNIS